MNFELNIPNKFNYFLALFINQNIMAMITTIPITPNQTPALKMPPIAAQLLKVIAITAVKNTIPLKLNLFILFIFEILN